MRSTARYVLMTSAKDEAAFVRLMLDSVAKQTIRPACHIVVDDGSADCTAQKIREFERRDGFVRLKTKDQNSNRSFGSKVVALQAAYRDLKALEFDYIGCLDADITLPSDYYERIIGKMCANQKLGLASGLCLQKSGAEWIRIMTNRQHVPGAMQFFRRECYEAIGGYQRVSVAGVDSLAEIKARMMGWETRSFEDIHAYHHKPIGSATAGKVKTAYRRGMTDYLLGKHPLYILAKSVRRLAAPPYVLDAVAHVSGYASLLVRNAPLDVADDIRRYVRAEEMLALRNALFRGERPY